MDVINSQYGLLYGIPMGPWFVPIATNGGRYTTR